MSVPKRHHYLPEFYLTRWAVSSGVLFEYSRPRHDVVVRARTPSGTGFKTGLYSIEGRQDPVAREEVELRFMQKLDEMAARSFMLLEGAKSKPDDGQAVSNWSRFVMSLVYRNPARIEEFRARIAGSANDETVRRFYEKNRSEGDPATYEEFIAEGDPGEDEEAKAYLIRRMIDSRTLGNHLNNMIWHIGDIDVRDHDLLLSDSPVVTSNGVGRLDGFLILPIGPRRFFLAVNQTRVRDYFLSQVKRGKFSAALNHAIVCNAEVLVIGSTASHKRFVERRLIMPGAPTRERVTWVI